MTVKTFHLSVRIVGILLILCYSFFLFELFQLQNIKVIFRDLLRFGNFLNTSKTSLPFRIDRFFNLGMY